MNIQKAFYSLALAITFFWILWIGKTVLIPFTMAVIVWYLSHSISSFYTLIWPKRFLNTWATHLLTMLGVISVIGILTGIVWGLSANLGDILQEIPLALQKALDFVRTWAFQIGIEIPLDNGYLKSMVNIENMIKNSVSTITSSFSLICMVFVYAIFLILEQGSFEKKLSQIFRTKVSQEKARNLIRTLDNKIKKYFLIKTSISIITAMIAYCIMSYTGLKFAGFFAVFVFLLNYIPTIGSILAIVLPTLFALTQFDVMTPVMILLIGMAISEIVIGNIIEPKIVGNSLNLSPVVILLSLVIWGKIWGLVGMFLCVPIMVSLNLLLSEFKETRKISILLSKDGDLDI